MIDQVQCEMVYCNGRGDFRQSVTTPIGEAWLLLCRKHVGQVLKLAKEERRAKRAPADR